MHRSMCPANVLAPDAAKLHGIIMNLGQKLEAEREARKAAEDAMEDLKAQDRGHAGMPHAPGSADGRQGRAEAEAKRAGLHEGRGNFPDSEHLTGMGGGDMLEGGLGLAKDDVEKMLQERTETLEETLMELNDLEDKNKELLNKVMVLERQLESRRHLAINGESLGGETKKASTSKPKHPFGKAPGFQNIRKSAGGGGETREFFVNPDDKYEDHPSNGLGDPLDPVEGWILDEVDRKDEADLNWDGDIDGIDGGDALPDFEVDPVQTSDGEAAHRGASPSASNPIAVDAELPPGRVELTEEERSAGEELLQRLAHGNMAGELLAQAEEAAMAKTKELLEAVGERERLEQEEFDRKESQRLAREAAERAEDEKQERLQREAERREAAKAERAEKERREAEEKSRREKEKAEREKAAKEAEEEANDNAARAAAEARAAADAEDARAAADAARKEESRLRREKREADKRAKKEADEKKKAAAPEEMVVRKPKHGKARTGGGGGDGEEDDDDDLAPPSKKKHSSKTSKLRQEPGKKSGHGGTAGHAKKSRAQAEEDDDDDDDGMRNSFKVPGVDDEFADDDGTLDGGGVARRKRKKAADVPAAEIKRRDEEARKFIGHQS
eukprot:g4963.t1